MTLRGRAGGVATFHAVKTPRPTDEGAIFAPAKIVPESFRARLCFVVKIAFVHYRRPANSNAITRVRVMALRRNAREPPRGAAGAVSQQEIVMTSAASQHVLLL